MKKIFFVLFGVMFISSFCFSQEPSEPINENASQSDNIKVFTGRVALIDFEERTKDFPARIEAVDEKGQRLVFVVAEKIPIRAKEGTAIMLRKIKNDEKITIEYIRARNSKIVQFIAVVE